MNPGYRSEIFPMSFSVLLRDRPEPRVEPAGVDLHLVRLLLRLGLALPGQGSSQHGRLGAHRSRLRRAGPHPRIRAGDSVINLGELCDTADNASFDKGPSR